MNINNQFLLDEAVSLLHQGNLADFSIRIVYLYDNIITCGCFLNGQNSSLWDSMLKAISDVEDDLNDFSINFSKGFIYSKSKSWELAHSYLSNAVKISPLSNVAWSLKSSVPSKYNPDFANDALEALALKPSARNYFVLAGITTSNGKERSYGGYSVRVVTPESDRLHKIANEKAVVLYNNALIINPDFACAYYNKAQSLIGDNSRNERIDCYMKCLRIEPLHWAWEYLWRVLDIKTDLLFYKEAVTILENAISHGSTENKLFLELSTGYRYLGNYEKAFEALGIIENTFIQDSGESELLLKLCAAYRGLGDYEKAFEAHEAYVKLNGSDDKSVEEYDSTVSEHDNSLHILFSGLRARGVREFQNQNYFAAKQVFDDYDSEKSIKKFKKTFAHIGWLTASESAITDEERTMQLMSIVKCEDNKADFSKSNDIYQQFVALKKSYHEKAPYGKTTSEDENNVAKLTAYEFSHKIGFGIYSGKKISEIVKIDNNYLLWCIINLKHFCVSNWILRPREFDKQAQYYEAVEINIIKNKLFNLWNPQSDDEDDIYSSYDDHDYARDNFDALTGGQLGDWEDFSGDIDDARDWMGLN